MNFKSAWPCVFLFAAGLAQAADPPIVISTGKSGGGYYTIGERLKTGVPVFLTWAERLPRGRGYALHLWALPEVTTATTLETSAAALNRGVEAAVRTLPAQYLWVYKRFKTRPPGATKLY